MTSLPYTFIRAALLLALLPCSAWAQTSCVKTYAALSQILSDSIELQVDTRCLPENNVIDNISYTIRFFDAGGAALGTMDFSTPREIRQDPDVQIFQVPQGKYPSAASATLIDFKSSPWRPAGSSLGPSKPQQAEIDPRPLVADPVTNPPVTTPEQASCVPALIVPGNGQRLPQRRLSNGRVQSRWMFRWHACPGAKRYHLFVIGPQAINPIVDNDAIPSENYLHRDTHYGITQRNGWTWKVRAFVDGEWGNWSPERSFDVAAPQ